MNAPATINNTPINILLVDDDDGDAKAVQRSFQKARIANPLTRAVDGMEALEMLKGTNGRTKLPSPCVMLVDLNMPRINGIQFIQALRSDKALHRSVVFVLTTSKRDEDKLAAYDLNVAGYIVKATAGADLMNLVNLVECYWRIVELP